MPGHLFQSAAYMILASHLTSLSYSFLSYKVEVNSNVVISAAISVADREKNKFKGADPIEMVLW